MRTDATGKTIDVLNYDYGTGTLQGNKLQTVIDGSDAAKGFTETRYASAGTDYTYDANGNLVFDKNKVVKTWLKTATLTLEVRTGF